MADEPLANIHFSLMQDILPVGLAMFERAKEGGASKMVEVFNTAKDPIKELRSEGELSAKLMRNRLDELSPGLGNPVMPVTVEVQDAPSFDNQIENKQCLLEILSRIEKRLDSLNEYFDGIDGQQFKNTNSKL